MSRPDNIKRSESPKLNDTTSFNLSDQRIQEVAQPVIKKPSQVSTFNIHVTKPILSSVAMVRIVIIRCFWNLHKDPSQTLEDIVNKDPQFLCYIPKEYQQKLVHEQTDTLLSYASASIAIKLIAQNPFLLKHATTKLQEQLIKQDHSLLKHATTKLQEQLIKQDPFLLKHATEELQEQLIKQDPFLLKYATTELQEQLITQDPHLLQHAEEYVQEDIITKDHSLLAFATYQQQKELVRCHPDWFVHASESVRYMVANIVNPVPNERLKYLPSLDQWKYIQNNPSLIQYASEFAQKGLAIQEKDLQEKCIQSFPECAKFTIEKKAFKGILKQPKNLFKKLKANFSKKLKANFSHSTLTQDALPKTFEERQEYFKAHPEKFNQIKYENQASYFQSAQDYIRLIPYAHNNHKKKLKQKEIDVQSVIVNQHPEMLKYAEKDLQKSHIQIRPDLFRYADQATQEEIFLNIKNKQFDISDPIHLNALLSNASLITHLTPKEQTNVWTRYPQFFIFADVESKQELASQSKDLQRFINCVVNSVP